MKPLNLTMEAFGAYAGLERLDFGELKGRSFFLIHGPTGAGKTTILDAMCFALYGDTSGALRDGKSMRSDHANAAAVTSVEFEFAVGPAFYRVRRQPEQERPKKRGEGTTIVPPEGMLWQLGPAGEVIIASGWSKVTEKIEQLLGFKSAQFRQVVLLPQGDFRRLLTASSTERQEIMQTLFKTDLYRDIEEKLKANALKLKKKYDELNGQREWLLKEAGVDTLGELNEKITNRQFEIEQAWTELKEVIHKLNQAQQEYHSGQLAQAKLHELAAAQQEYNDLIVKVPLVEEKKAELRRAVNAAALTDLEAAFNKTGHELQEAAGKCELLAVGLTAAKDQLHKAEQQLAVEIGRESEREAAGQEVRRLNELNDKVSALAASLKQLEAARQAAVQAEQDKDKLKAALTKADEEKLQLESEYKAAFELAVQLPKWQMELDHVSLLINKRTEKDKVKASFILAERNIAEIKTKAAQLEREFLTAKHALTEMQERWAGGQAAVMAGNLAEGRPCPVCGSLHHPEPAKSYGETIPDESRLKAGQQSVEQLDKRREMVKMQLIEQETALKALAEKSAAIEQELGTNALVELTDLEQRLTDSRKSYNDAVSAQKKTAMLKKELDLCLSSIEVLAEQLPGAEKIYQQRTGEWKTAEGIANERQQAVPVEFTVPAALEEAKQQAVRKHTMLKAALEAAQQRLKQANERLIQLKSSFDNAVSNRDGLNLRCLEERQNFTSRISIAGFAGIDDYRQAKKTTDYIKKLDERIRLFELDLAAKKDRLERSSLAAAGITAPDMILLSQAVELAQAAHGQVLSRKTSLTEQLEREQKWLTKLEQLDEHLAAAAGSYEIIGRLADVANGGNAYKMTFQRYVLGALLQDVADAANQRLKMMSRGRYYLQRTLDRARKNAAGGLDLEVFDNYTGVARGVGTLSGGETFLASLSLALGLADVVQSYAGGMHLETIFVDEGFGTLDPETLDFAIKALIDLQQGGRLVGIISHVPELKERIDARLEVSLTERGSKACFRVS